MRSPTTNHGTAFPVGLSSNALHPTRSIMDDRLSPASLEETLTVSADELVRRVYGRYLFVLLAVAILVAADQAVIQPLLMRMNVFAPAINLAGRQRMLSQRLAKAALAIQAAGDAATQAGRRTEVQNSLEEWTAAHHTLRHGAAEGTVFRILTPALDEEWTALQPHFDAMQSAARQLVAAPVINGSHSAAIATLVDHEAPFLSTMERIVQLMEQQAAKELDRLRAVALAIALGILGLILGLGRFVVRPAVRAIRNQVDHLEARVDIRTQELNVALSSLRHEIRERETTEARNRNLATQLAHAHRVESLGRLAAGLAHELNQPLGAIANYAAACEATLADSWEQNVPGRLKHCLQQLQQASLRAGAIIRRTRNFVAPGTSNVSAVDINSLVVEVVDLCRPEAARMDVEVALDLPADEVVVIADPIQIQQVLVNLVQNGLQAMTSSPPEHRRLSIHLCTRSDNVQVDVIDSGSGLADADLETLFAPFHTTKADGLGIGLSICRSIIEQHQGTIFAKSLPLEGAQFSFVLPLASEHALQPVC